jgi:AcrR family transcriptional regulator
MDEPRRATARRRADRVLDVPPAQGRGRSRGRNRARGTSPARGQAARRRGRGEFARGDTRERIQSIALGLFAEQGYEKTSLREIAERLGVTKAALYYHFRSKEDIVRGFTEDYRAEIEAVISWGAAQPPTPQTRAEILARYADIVTRRLAVIRFMHHNQATMLTLMSGTRGKMLFREQFVSLCNLLAPPGSPLPERIRAAMAIVSIGMTSMLFLGEAASPQELQAAALEVAYDLADAKVP